MEATFPVAASYASDVVPVRRRTATVAVDPSRYDNSSPAVSAVCRFDPRIAGAYL